MKLENVHWKGENANKRKKERDRQTDRHSEGFEKYEQLRGTTQRRESVKNKISRGKEKNGIIKKEKRKICGS